MIKVNLFNDKMSDIDRRVNEYVNENLKVMIEGFRDYLYMDNGEEVKDKLYYHFPRHFIDNSSVRVDRIIEELYELICRHNVREFIMPKYELVLYHIINWWIDCNDFEEDLIPVKLSNDLLKRIEENDEYINEDEENTILKAITDIEEYLVFCFQDYDFLTDSLDSVVQLYLTEPILVKHIYNIDLDDYVDLMSSDLRELYIEFRKEEEMKKEKKKVIDKKGLEEIIIKEIYIICSEMNKHIVEMRDKSEVELSNEIFRAAKRILNEKLDVIIERESEIGHAKIKLGENDFYLYKHSDDLINIAIGENKVLEKFNDAYGQLLGYLSYNFQFGFTISINRNKTIREATDFILKYLKENSYKDFPITSIDINPLGDEYNYVIKSTHTLPEDNLRSMDIYHLILDMNDEVRAKVAKKARKPL